ncbi:MAG TPA: thiamine pyrophosphate-dependent enzyme, partial [Pseudonocardia sp.]
AAANLFPAVLEAAYAGVPLLALTADRPAELVGTGASQTIDQVGMFGTAVRLAPAVGGTQAQVRVAVDRAVAAACGTPPGPVHLNLPFKEPLIPDDATWPTGRDGGAPWTTWRPGHADVATSSAGAPPPSASPLPLDPAAPTVVIAGPGSPALDVGVPVIAEPSSASWSGAVRTGPWLLGRPDLAPEQVVVAGRPTLHRAAARLLGDPGVAVYALADDRGMPWTDVAGSVRAIGALPSLRPDPEWLRRWADADKVAAAALDEALDEGAGALDGQASVGRAPAGLRLARALVAALPNGAQLVLGSSNPVRDVALAAAPRGGLVVRSNRGVAGIDGTVSTAIGAALAHDGPTVALLGDLTLLHDTTGLVIGPDEPRPDLTFVVLNDNGGGIFNLLEQGAHEHSAAFERVFGTPHRVDLAALCAAIGVAHVRAEASDVAAHLGSPGLRLVEVTAERGGLRAGHAALRAHIAAAVGR